MHADILSTISLNDQSKLPINRLSDEGGIRHHFDSEKSSPIGRKYSSESFRKYAFTRLHAVKYFGELQKAACEVNKKIK
jgi:hypothetical protein